MSLEVDRQVQLADLRLQDEYPGQYVAFVDIWTIREEVRLLERRVLAHARDFHTMNQQLEATVQASPMPLESIRSTYVHDPKAGIEDRYEVG